jgi:predicted nucleic acid-binding protein
MPHLADVEVASVLRRLVAADAISERLAREALEDLADLGIDRHAHDPLLERIWELRRNVSAYDASYVALAEVLDAPLLTCDKRLKRASGTQAQIEVM